MVGIAMHLDDQAVGTNRDSSTRQRSDRVAPAGGMAGIDDDGQVGQLLYHGNDADIEGVAGVVGKGADAALAEHHVIIALAHDVLGGHQQFIESGGNAALEQHRFIGSAGKLEQSEVLHVAGADLNHVGVLRRPGRATRDRWPR